MNFNDPNNDPNDPRIYYQLLEFKIAEMEEKNAKEHLDEIRAERVALEKEGLKHPRRMNKERLEFLKRQERNAEKRYRKAQNDLARMNCVFWFFTIVEAIAVIAFAIFLLFACVIK